MKQPSVLSLDRQQPSGAYLMLSYALLIGDVIASRPAFEAAAKGETVAPDNQPRTEVVIDLNPAYNNKGGVIIALRVG